MQQEAANRIWDDLLQLLALEILLKRLGLKANGKIPHGHNYKQLFCDLPAEQQRRIIENAAIA